jgi:hypothetical protein
MLAFGAFGRVGFRLPGLGLAGNNDQCYPERDGMLCGDCGICQRGQCIPNSTDTCRNFFSGGWKDMCGRCRAKDQSCVFCGKGQVCCKDGCCDGPCSADGICCPTGRKCGDDCCRGCDVCRDGKCEKPAPQKFCPPNYTLIDGCCVCQPRLCGGQCCPEDETCLDGKCCKTCGKDHAICCDDPAVSGGGAARPRVCCRERCQDADKKCCPCKEDISPDEGKEILKRAQETMKYVKDNGITYALGRGDKTMDCSDFCGRSLAGRNTRGNQLHTRNLDGNCDFRRLEPGESPQAGDVLAQPRSSGPPGSQHVGISQGAAGPKGGQLGLQMGNSGANVGVWGLPQGEGGWFEGGDQLRGYRPQKSKTPCKD